MAHLLSIFHGKSFWKRIETYCIVVGEEKCQATFFNLENTLAVARSVTSVVNLISNILFPRLTVVKVMVYHPQVSIVEVSWRLTSLGGIDEVTEVSTYVEILDSECLFNLEDLVSCKATAEPVDEHLKFINRRSMRHFPEADCHHTIIRWNCHETLISFPFGVGFCFVYRHILGTCAYKEDLVSVWSQSLNRVRIGAYHRYQTSLPSIRPSPSCLGQNVQRRNISQVPS